MRLLLGTRGSTLARTQSQMVADALEEAARARGIDLTVDLHIVTTEGDTTTTPLTGQSSVGVFVSALRQALLAGECDLAVHSLKDMPVDPAEGIELAAIPVREDARDALCAAGKSLGELPHGAKVGTGSPRRAAQLLATRPDLDIQGLRGNVDTRLKAVGERYDAIVLAAAGLNRIGRGDEASQLLTYEVMVPAPGQGALAVEIRSDADAHVADVVRLLDDPLTRAAVTAERAALRVLEAGCSAPVGAYARIQGDRIRLHVRVIAPDGSLQLNEVGTGPLSEASAVGRAAAHALLGRGASQLMRST